MRRILRFLLDPLGLRDLRQRVKALEASPAQLEILARDFFSKLPPFPDAVRPGRVDIDGMTLESFRQARNWIAAREGRPLEPKT
jgi:hypothetical protein